MNLARIFLPLVAATGVLSAQDAPPNPSKLGPRHVVVVYNKKVPASQTVAQAYVKARGLEASQVVGLDCPTDETITREQFRTTIREPLRDHFTGNSWWKLRETGGGSEAVECRFRVLVLVQGMPLRVSRDAAAAQGKVQQAAINEASVDSELALLGVQDYPLDFALENPYFKKKEDFSEFSPKSLFIVSRLDGPDAATAQRLATEAVEVEKAGGPWGRAVIDLSGFYPMGDEWLRNIFDQCWKAGIPAQIDRHKWALTSFYPLTDCALYYGWYDWNANGFLLDPAFRFRPGTIAAHIHSFSAETLRSPTKNWTGPLVAKGATATVGNVYEPYLELTHQLDVFNEALLAGYTLGEASLMSLPRVSWMNILVGDPLYRPFAGRGLETNGRFPKDANASYRAVFLALTRWGNDPAECCRQLVAAGQRTKDATLFEAAGLLAFRNEKYDDARQDFEMARVSYAAKPDQLRSGMLVAECWNGLQKKSVATETLRSLEKEFAGLPQVKAVTEQISKLNPPSPPPAAPKPPAPAGKENKK